MVWAQKWILIAVAGCLVGAAHANNLVVTNVTLASVTNGTADIQFDLSWSNSWRYTVSEGGTNVVHHDAAWVFVKFRVGGEWRHAWLTDTGHTAAAGSQIQIGANGGATNVGAFVFRSTDSAGYMNCPNMRLRWNYVGNGLTGTNNVDISVQAVEMVFIPEGPFSLGTGGGEQYSFYTYPNTTEPYLVTNSEEIVVGTETGNLYYASQGDHGSPIDAGFPNGFDAFYCMKHELTQGAYTRFLNMLPSGEDFLRFPDQHGVNNHKISESGGVFSVDDPDRACNFLSWLDLRAYLDWAGLRPMSELEFEKVCRGPQSPGAGEFAWGDTTLIAVETISGVDGSGTETSGTANANCVCHSFMGGPVRVGMFATDSSSRHAAGAGYYGVMELSGNVVEQIVNVGKSEGRAFRGNPGDGDTATAPSDWPATYLGMGSRGAHWATWGSFGADIPQLNVSNRRYADQGAGTRGHNGGGRGVRTVP